MGYVTAGVGFLDTGKESVALRNALQAAKVPVVYIPKRLRVQVKPLFSGHELSPQALCAFLKNADNRIKSWTDGTKQVILEYLLSEPGLTEYGALELFPFEDGKYRSIESHPVFVHRDASEKELFALEKSRNIDLDKFSAPTRRALEACQISNIHPSIQQRTVKDFRRYCVETVFAKFQANLDLVVLDATTVTFLSKAWTWIIKQKTQNLDGISNLWLVPLTNGHYRKVVPQKSTLEVLVAPEGEIRDLLHDFAARCSLETGSLLDSESSRFSPETVRFLVNASREDPKLLIKDGSNVVHLAQWLFRVRAVLASALDEEKDLVVRFIALNLPNKLSTAERRTCTNALSSLEIFKKVSWKVDGAKSYVSRNHFYASHLQDVRIPRLEWTSLSASKLSNGLVDSIIPVPWMSDVQFLDAQWSSFSHKILADLGLATCLGTIDIIELYIIPAWESGKTSSWTNSCKEQVAELLLSQYSRLSVESRKVLRTLPMVPVMRINGDPTLKFSIAANLVDSSVSSLKGLFFDDEEVLPAQDFFDRFGMALKDCGLKTVVDETLVNGRIRSYASRNREPLQVQQRAHRLLESACNWSSPTASWELQQLEWLPVLDTEGTLALKAPKQCRGIKDRLLCGDQLHILEFPISVEWEKRLGWRDRLPNSVLLAQLTQSLGRNDRAVVDAVLIYIDREEQTEQLAKDLLELPCILTSTDIFVTPSRAFRPPTNITAGFQRLHPYLGSVDNSFWYNHEKLLTKLKIREMPSLEDLLSVQKLLESKTGLDDIDVVVAIEILNFASLYPRESLVDLKIFSDTMHFCPIQDISYNEIGILPVKELQKVNLTHPDIPVKTVHALGIETVQEKLLKGLLEIEDTDEDEFDQREDVITRIVDTLDRYKVDTTFREYLANADDTKGASKISWLLDERVHQCESLLTPDLSRFQGPALLVYNDGGKCLSDRFATQS